MTTYAVVGSRDYPSLELVDALIDTFEPDDAVISGGARGPDMRAETAALARGDLFVVSFRPAQTVDGVYVIHKYVGGELDHQQGSRIFSRFAPAAFFRNGLIVGECDELHAFWDGTSRGTMHSIQLAMDVKVPVTIHDP